MAVEPTRNESLELLRGQSDGIHEWNRQRRLGLDVSLDLAGVDLSNTDLTGANLIRANLIGANLTNARLDSASLRDASIRQANLREATLVGVDLRNADLSEANLRSANLTNANLTGAHLGGTDLAAAILRRANLFGVDALVPTLGLESRPPDLRNANLSGTDMRSASLQGANLIGARLDGADLDGANLHDATLDDASLVDANLHEATLADSSLVKANLRGANLTSANLHGARLARANLVGTNLAGAHLARTDMKGVTFGGTILANLDLTLADLTDATHIGPSHIATSVLARARGRVSAAFLRGCGLSPWEAEIAQYYDPTLDAAALCDLFTTRVLPQLRGNPLAIGGVFISYAHADSDFVEKLRQDLYDAGASVWLDKHDLKAGDLQKQIGRAIRIQDIVLLVLSEASLKSDWVEHELEMARKKEQSEARDVLCPVALDTSWKHKVVGDVLWRQLAKKNILDFSHWRTAAYAKSFQRLSDGLKVNYEKR